MCACGRVWLATSPAFCPAQLFVLETADESKGPGAFQMLQYIKLQLDPQVRERRSMQEQRAAPSVLHGHQHLSVHHARHVHVVPPPPCIRLPVLCCAVMRTSQIIILSATADPALIEAAKLPAATAAGAASTGDGSSAEPTVQLQRPSLFVYNKVVLGLCTATVCWRCGGKTRCVGSPAGSHTHTALTSFVLAIDTLCVHATWLLFPLLCCCRPCRW